MPILAEKVIIPLLLIAITLTLGANPLNLSWLFRAGSSVVLLLAAGAVAVDLHRRQRRDASTGGTLTLPALSPLTPVATPPVVERVYADADPAFLTRFFWDHTRVQADSLIGVYIGKWIRVDAPVDDVSASLWVWFQTADLSKNPREPRILACFTERWKDRLVHLRRGTRLTVVGRIAAVDALTVRLEDCEIEKS